MRAWLLGALVVLLCLPGPAGAQTELESAERNASSSLAELEAARQEVDAWAARLDSVEARLVAALYAYEQSNGLLEAAALRVFELRDEIQAAERRVGSLRRLSEERAATAYMNGALDLGMLVAVDFAETALLAEATSAVREADAQALESFALARQKSEDLKRTYEDDQRVLADLRADLAVRARSLEQSFAAVGASLAVAERELAAADTRYRNALSELDAGRRRRAAALGVSVWGTQVERYFADDLVDQALLVMACESGGDPDATHPESGAAGLFQFLPGTWVFASAGAGFAGASRYDPEANIAAAAWLVDYSVRTGHPGGAWGHWVCKP